MPLESLSLPKSDHLTPAETAAKAEDLGVSKSALPLGQSFALSIMAGAFISMGAMFFLLAVSDAALPFAAQRVLGGVLFSLGLLLVVVCGAELFTGNTLMVMTAASKRIRWSAVWKNWIVVFVGNFVGSLVMVGVVYLAGFASMNDGAVGQTIVSVAAGKMTPSWITLFAKGIMCNFLVCLAVWIAYASKTVADKMLGIMLPIAAFVACGFEHCVANMFFLPMGLLLNSMGVGAPDAVTLAGIATNLSAATLGNVAGGVAVGMAYWFVYRKKDVDR